MTRKPLMVGNWKMFKTARETGLFLEALSNLMGEQAGLDYPDFAVCPPFTALAAAAQVRSRLSIPIGLGAQNMDSHLEGAYTGEISASMLAEFQVQYVLLGHSERRQYFNETDAGTNAKIKTALANNLTPIVCVGETLAERDANQLDKVIETQVKGALHCLDATEVNRLVFAYEPVWAIGTGKVCDAVEANRVIRMIRQHIQNDGVRILYGGSMKPDNVAALMSQPEIDGGLVGGASLAADSFYDLTCACVPTLV